jgi:metaxin
MPNSSAGPIPASKLRTTLVAASIPNSKPAPPSPPEAAPYASLIDHPIRRAYLHTLYLSVPNTPVLTQLYLAPTTHSSLVRAVLLRQLRAAAEDEILASGGGYTAPLIDVEGLYADAKAALEALNALLAGRQWFFCDERGGSESGPTEFDAAVFAYTDVLLNEELGWRDTRLGDLARGCDGLVKHRRRILTRYWPNLARSK